MNACKLEMRKIQGQSIAIVKINRPESANAFNAELMRELTETFVQLQSDVDVRAVILTGEGKHFSAGADLAWMKDSAKLSYEENISDSKVLAKMFRSYFELKVPTIAIVKGATFGGAVGLVAASDIVLADSQAKFCLSEVKLGLVPAVIYPYLIRKIHSGALKRWAITGRVVRADEAKSIGLVDEVGEDLSEILMNELNLIFSAGSFAISEAKGLHEYVLESGAKAEDHCIATIAKVRTGEEAQHGLAMFFEKKKPQWNIEIKEKSEVEI